jgi:NMD protein affecting ribosome stability and mRNA decay
MEKCKECGKPTKGFIQKAIGLCGRCYNDFFPERPCVLPSHRRFYGGKWIDIRVLMTWWNDGFVRKDEEQEVSESMDFLREERYE